MNSWVSIVQLFVAFMSSVIMPILLFVITKHANTAAKNAEKVVHDIEDLGKKLDSHILWHLGGHKE